MKDNSDNKSTTRWKDFADEELRIIVYGLAQIHGDQIIEKLLSEINPLVFPVKKNGN